MFPVNQKRFDFRLAVEGRLLDTIAEEQATAARGYTRGIEAATELLKRALRADVIGAGLGERLAKTWQSKVYPQREASLSAAGSVFSKASKIIQGYDEGALIRRRDASGTWLAIPTKDAPRYVLGGQKVTPGRLERAWGIRLDMVYLKGRGIALLVANLRRRQGKRGGFAAPNPNAKRKQKLESVVLFVLVPQVRLKRRLDVESTYLAVADQVAAIVADHLERELRHADDAY